MTTLRIDQVSKVFRATSGGRSGLTPALRKVSFDIDQGEFVTLIGESGSGKTTLGRIVLRLISASGGTVWFDGSDISGYKGAQLRDYYRHVQGLFQDPFSSYNRSTRQTGCSSCCASRTLPACRSSTGRTRLSRRCTPSR